MATSKKHAGIHFKTQPTLLEAFDTAFKTQQDFTSKTAFFEDCMRALIEQKTQRLRIPLKFLPRDDPPRRPGP